MKEEDTDAKISHSAVLGWEVKRQFKGLKCFSVFEAAGIF